MADEESKSKFMDILARGAEGAVDGLAESYPILGGAVQAMVNTDEYQARQLRQRAARASAEAALMQSNEFTSQEAQDARAMARNVALQQGKEFLAGEAAREDQRRYEQEQRDESRSRKGTRDAVDAATRKSAEADAMKSDEFMSESAQAARKSSNDAATEQNKLKAAQARYLQDQLDQQQFAERANGKRKALEDELSKSPYFLNMTFDEQREYLNSPDVQNMLDAAVYLEDIQGMAKGDKDAFGRLERALSRQGWDLVDGKDGMMYLDMGNGTRIAATPQNIAQINQMVNASAFEELNARNQISMAACLGNPAQSSVSKYAKALMPYNNNSAARSLKQVQSVYENASPEQKTWTFFNQAFQDYNNPKLPTAAKLDGLQKCLPGLQQLGYTLEGYDPKNPSLDSVVLKNGKDILSVQQFADLCKSRDVISAQLDDMVERSRVATGRAAIVEAVKNVKSTGKAENPEETPEEVEARKVEKYRSDIKSLFDENEDFWSLGEEEQEKVITSYENYERHKNAALKKYKAKDVYGLPENTVKALDNLWNDDMKSIGINKASSLNRSPVRDVLDDLKALENRHSSLNKDYETAYSVVHDYTGDIKPAYASMTTTRTEKGVVPKELRARNDYRSISEKMEHLKGASSKLEESVKKKQNKK